MKRIFNYSNFVNENIEKAKSIINKKMVDYEKLKILLSKNLGYIGKFTEYLFNENIPYNELEKLYYELINLKSKSNPININELKYEKVLDQIQNTKNSMIIKSFINQLPFEQKTYVKEILKNNENLILQVAQKDNVKNFISKIARYKDKNSLFNALKIFSKDPVNDLNKIKEILKNMESNIVYDKNNIVIVEVKNYEDIKILGSDTSWCIVNSKSTWDSYTKNRYQFIIYNYELDEYDPNFKIGFTLNNDGSVYTSHNIIDSFSTNYLNNLMVINNINYIDLLPKLNIDTDILKINRRTPIKNIIYIINTCEHKQLPILINKLMDVFYINDNLPSSTITNYIKKMVYKYFEGQDIVYVEDILKINKKLFLIDGITTWDKLINKYINTRLNETNFKIGINSYWNDSNIIYSFSDYSNIYNNVIVNYSKDTIKTFSNRLNSIYSSDINVDISNKKLSINGIIDTDTPYTKGIKYPLNYELCMLLLNAYLDRKESTPNYEQILNNLIKNHKYIVNKYVNELDLTIDLEEIGITLPIIRSNTEESMEKNSETINRIIKKDYLKTNLYIDPYYMSFYNDIAKHLEGYKLHLNITKTRLKQIFYHKNSTNDILLPVLSKFTPKSRIGTTVTEGDISITLR